MQVRRIAAVSMLAILPFVSGCFKDTANSEIVPVMVTQAALPSSDNSNHVYSGNIEPDVTVNASFTIGGYVRGILNVPGQNGQVRLVQEGDIVRKGTVLAHVRDVDYLAQVNIASAQVAGKIALTEQSQYGLQQTQAALDRASAAVSQAGAARDEAHTGYAQARAGLAAAQSQLAEAQAASQAASALVEQAEAGREKAQSDFGRAERLYSAKSLTRSDYDAAKAQLKVANAQVKAAKEQVNVAGTKIEQAKVQIEATRSKMDQTKTIIEQSEAVIKGAKAQRRAAEAAVNGAKAQINASAAGTKAAKSQLTQAETPLGDASLKAPIDGVVLKRNIEIGTLVGPGTPGFVIANLSSVKVVLGVPDVLVKQLHLGDRAVVSTQAYENRQFVGRVTSISPAADPRSHVFKVEVTVPNADRVLKVGMIAKAELGANARVGVSPVIPLSAIVKSPRNGSDYAVYVVAKERGKSVARAHEITLGETFGNSIEVTSGVKIGDPIVSTGATMINDGTPVSVLK